MPNRIIKDSIRTSKSVNSMTDFQFRLWVYLITYVDDYGRGSADPELLKGLVFPRRRGVTESTIRKALSDLANSGSVLLYEVGGEPYFCFPNWNAHQRVQTKKSKYPAPEEGRDICISETHREPPCSTVGHRESPPESNPIQSESNPNPNPNPNTKARAARFTPPTLEEVQAYVAQRHSPVDPQGFIDFYEMKGWKVGKEVMVDWKAACRSAERWDRWSKPAAEAKTRAEPPGTAEQRVKADMDRMRAFMKRRREDKE